jgi:hypothetical protein
MSQVSTPMKAAKTRAAAPQKMKVGPQTWWERPTAGHAGQGQGDRTPEKARGPTLKWERVVQPGRRTPAGDFPCNQCAKPVADRRADA